MTSPSTVKRGLPLLALLALACAPPDAGRPDFRLRDYATIVAAEDARHIAGENLEILRAGTRSADPFLRGVAVRALGRLEAPALLPDIAEVLADEDPGVRSEAVNAVAQAVHGEESLEALSLLMDREAVEVDPVALGTLARSLGRLSVSGSHRREVARALVRLSRAPEGGDPSPRQAVGVALGMESFARARRGGSVSESLVDRLRDLMFYRVVGEQTPDVVRTRTVATAALAASGAMGVTDVERALRDDPAESVRRVAAARLDIVGISVRAEFIRRLLVDPSPQVRLEGVRAIARGSRDGVGCQRLMAVVGNDPTAVVRLAALDALAAPCPNPGAQVALLREVAESLGDAGVDWHEPAHALTSLAALAPGEASSLLGRFAAHDDPFVRMYAAQAAVTLRDVAALRALLADINPNVVTVAAGGLGEIQGRIADPLLVEILDTAEDPQLLLTVAGLLGDTSRREETAATALATLERLTEQPSQTLYDARVALLTLVGRVGGPDLASEVEGYIRDSDRRIADEAERILLAWTGDRYIASPRTPERLATPTAEELARLSRTEVVFHMASGGSFTVRVEPTWAATNAHRFVGIAADGGFDGLTFHRVVSNFIVQGGSPGANEYAGHGTYTRDEVGLPVQWRGTVGLSTRGRDTGDGQFYVNLVDNPRLDHDYTVFGTVTAGMDVVDAALEGTVIQRAEIRTWQ